MITKNYNQDEKHIMQYTANELKELLGNFEKEYNESATGETIHNPILGFVKQGTVDHAIRFGAITKKFINNKVVYFIKLPEYRTYELKLNALKELNAKRGMANNNSDEAFETLIKSKAKKL